MGADATVGSSLWITQCSKDSVPGSLQRLDEFAGCAFGPGSPAGGSCCSHQFLGSA